MARSHYRDTIMGVSGSTTTALLLTSATVNVFEPGTSTPIAQTIYAASSGGSGVTNPLTAGSTTAAIDFWLDRPQNVDLVISKTGFTTTRVTVLVNEPATSATTVYDVTDYGAIGDGTTDCSTAINLAIAAALAGGGGTVFFPPGTFIIDAIIGLESNVHMIGAGKGATTLKLKDAANCEIMRRLTAANGVRIAYMTLNGNKVNQTPGGNYQAIALTLANRFLIEDVYVFNSVKIGISLAGCTYCTVRNCITENTATTGIWVGTSGSTHSTGSRVEGNVVLTPGLDGILVDCDDVTVVNNYISGAVYSAGVGYSGIYVGVARFRVVCEGNTCKANSNYGIDYDTGTAVSSYGCIVLGNTCNGNRNAGITVGAYGSVISGNVCVNNGQTLGAAPDAPYGIRVGGDDIIVTGNILHDTQGGSATQTYGVYLADGTTRATVSNNNMRGNVTLALRQGTATATKTFRNHGWVTENKGTSAVANGTTSIAVTHSLAVTPAIQDIFVTLTNNPTNNVRHWVSAVSSTTFTVTTSADPGAATLAFAWQANVL